MSEEYFSEFGQECIDRAIELANLAKLVIANRKPWKYCPYCGMSLLCIDVEEHRRCCCGWPR